MHLAESNIEVILPGYTHLQRAQPVLLAHHLLAYYDMLERDRGRLADTKKRLNLSPLGSAALAGTPFPLDRGRCGSGAWFRTVPTTNSIDAVSDRDFCRGVRFGGGHDYDASFTAQRRVWS